MNLLHGPEPSMAATAGFLALAAAVPAAAVLAAGVAARDGGAEDGGASARRRTAAALAAWMAATGVLAAAGVLVARDSGPPPLFPVVGLSAVASTWIALSRFGAGLARHVPLAVLVGFQVFRVPLELVLDRLFLDGMLPPQMTFRGMNYDIASGATAAALGLWLAFGRPPLGVVRAWNLLGNALLLVIVGIAIASAPGPLRVFPNEPANTIVSTFPFVWLPTVLVQAAWIGHLLVWRRLAIEGRAAKAVRG